jgi:hypothetical protein
MGFYSLKVGQSPSKFFDKVFDAGLHDQSILSKKTLTKLLVENFNRVNDQSTLFCDITVDLIPLIKVRRQKTHGHVTSYLKHFISFSQKFFLPQK